MENRDKIKNLIRKGREIGYILIDDLDKCLADFNETDKQYVIETLDGMEIQLIQTIDEYDEFLAELDDAGMQDWINAMTAQMQESWSN